MQHYNRCRNGMFYRYTVCYFTDTADLCSGITLCRCLCSTVSDQRKCITDFPYIRTRQCPWCVYVITDFVWLPDAGKCQRQVTGRHASLIGIGLIIYHVRCYLAVFGFVGLFIEIRPFAELITGVESWCCNNCCTARHLIRCHIIITGYRAATVYCTSCIWCSRFYIFNCLSSLTACFYIYIRYRFVCSSFVDFDSEYINWNSCRFFR